MDSRTASFFPFIRHASKLVSDNGADIESLISSPSFERARSRGIERVEQAIDRSEVDGPSGFSEFDRLMEIMSYPYARMIVSCVNDKFLTRRYALAESVKMNKTLSGESLENILYIAKELEVNSTIEDEKLKMHFSDYLSYSTRIKSVDWKLVNADVHDGYVFLTRDKFDRVLQNALQDRIESELPIDVPDNIRKIIGPDVNRISAVLVEAKNRFNPQMGGPIDLSHMPPCIRTLLSSAQNGVNLPHSGRFALVSFLHAIGMDSAQILTLFAQSPDFDESKSSYQIRHITGELNGTDGYTPPECSTMKTNGICYDPDDLCANEKVNHPLTYYRIKSRTGRSQPES